MEEVKITKTVEAVICYRADDGKEFDTRDECIAYEKTAKAAAGAAAKTLQCNCMEAASAFDMFCACCEDPVVVYDIKTANDLQVVNTHFLSLYHRNSVLGPEYIGHKVAVGKNYYDDCVFIYGSRADMESRFAKLMDKLFADPEVAE